jgi:hypothetical protein
MTARSGGRRLPEITRLWGRHEDVLRRVVGAVREVLEEEMTEALGGQGQADGRVARLPLAANLHRTHRLFCRASRTEAGGTDGDFA